MKELKKDFTEQEVIKLLAILGSEEYKKSPDGTTLIFKTVCHHGDSYKLYYYINDKLFHCYTDCGDSFDIYELVRRSKDCAFYEAVSFINEIFGLRGRRKEGFEKAEPNFTDDWEIFQKYHRLRRKKENPDYKIYSESLLDYYTKAYPIEWLNEGITKEAMDKFNIRFDIANNKIVIPHYDLNGNLIGIRGRALNQDEIDAGKKYMPCIINKNTILKHPIQFNLYGYYQNRSAISRAKKVVIFEAEKSVLKCEGFYGNNNFTVAVCGNHISSYQRSMILNLGVKEVMIAFDRDYHEASKEEAYDYANKILNIAYTFCPYVTTYVLWDKENILGYKDSPADKGQEVLEKLMKQKYEVETKDEKDN